MKLLTMITLVLILQTTLFAELPNIHSSIVLDAKFYSGENSNTGNYDTSNRIQIRKAVLEFTGTLDKKIDYALEFGLSTCTGSGLQLKLMDASIFYNFNENIKAGLLQGHVLRGFIGKTECSERLTLEKPMFFKTFATCHPTGFVVNTNFDLGEAAGLETELALMNGVNGTFDGEHDYNLGLIFHTPLSGLAISSDYNHTEKSYYDENYQLYSETGYRSICGLKYDNYNFQATGEYLMGKGFTYDDQEMTAYYLQAGYAFPMKCEFLNYIQPYAVYEFWDKNSAEDDESEYTYINAGLTIGLTESTKVKFNYMKPQDKPDSAPEEASSFIVRLQTGF